jgi:Ca2+-binding RTX toxin-like protein
MLNNQSLQSVQNQLAHFASQSNFDAIMATAFGARLDRGKLQLLRQQWLNGNFSIIPDIQVLSQGELNGANGAYAASLDRIFVSSDFLAHATNSQVTALILEEVGHRIDQLLNNGVDSAGDEGEIFGRLVEGQSLSSGVLATLRSQNDHSSIRINGQLVAVENSVGITINGTAFADIITPTSLVPGFVTTVNDDTVYAGDGNDTVDGGNGNDYIDLGGGDDSLNSASSGNDTFIGGSGNDYIFGGFDNEIYDGGSGNDTLKGDASNDTLSGGLNDDSLEGGSGNDVYLIDADTDIGLDTLVEFIGGGVDSINFHNTTTKAILFTLQGTGSQTIDTGIQVTTSDWGLFENLSGGSLNDTLDGNGSANILYGNNGDDTIDAQGENDIVHGGDGDDDVRGGNLADGDDTLYGDNGNDTLFGGAGNDSMSGGNGNDSLLGYYGNDILYGDNGDDNLDGYSGDDTVYGGDGNDTVYGDSGNDSLYGGNGNDYIYDSSVDNDSLSGGSGDDILVAQGYTGNDTLDGGDGDDSYIINPYFSTSTLALADSSGIDTLTFEGAGNIAIILSSNSPQSIINNLVLTSTALGGIENIIGNIGSDSLTGNDLDNSIFGGENNDSLNGGNGDDFLDGGNGNDSCQGATGNDTLSGAGGDDILRGGIGDDYLSGGSGNGSLFGEDGNDYVSGGSDPDKLDGGNGNDELNGGDSDDTLIGGVGADTMVGGIGSDLYYIDNVGDLIVENSYEGKEQVNSSIGYSLGNGLENLTLQGTVNINGTGNSLNNKIIGNSGINALCGKVGNDTLIGADGNDVYIIDADVDLGLDIITEAAVTTGGIDTIDLRTSAISTKLDLTALITQTIASGVQLAAIGAQSIEYVYGGSGNDTIIGNAANNVFIGGAGSDSITGGLGNELYIIDADVDLGTDTLIELVAGGIDALDFRSTTTKAITLNLDLVTNQLVATGVNLMMPSGQIEYAYGGSLGDNLIGNSLNNYFIGGAGNDTLKGGIGSDYLTGGIGNDTFCFQGVALTGANNGTNTVATALGRDTISDFVVGTDKIALSKATFAALTSAVGGAIGSNFVTVTNDTLAGGQSAAIVYSTSSGNLFYNSDGTTVTAGVNGGLGINGGNFAVLLPLSAIIGLPSLTAADFAIVV